MKSNEQIKEDWYNLDNRDIDAVCDILRQHEHKAEDYLANIVASLCDVSIEEMFSNTNVARLTHARWLFWYACRYKTTFSYDTIAKRTERYGHPYDLRTIQSAVNKMSSMIDTSIEWAKRWEVVRRIIKLREEPLNNETKNDEQIVIIVPKSMKDRVDIRVK